MTSAGAMPPRHDYSRLARDGAAFSALYRGAAQDVLVFLARRTYDPEIAADLMAETFARAFLGRRRFRGSTLEEARAWIFGIARKRLAMYLRRGRAEQRALRRLGLERSQLRDGEYARIEELAGLDEIRRELAGQLGRLAPGQRRALELRVVGELSYPEVADQLGISEQAARARVSRGLRILGSALEGVRTAEG